MSIFFFLSLVYTWLLGLLVIRLLTGCYRYWWLIGIVVMMTLTGGGGEQGK